MDMHDPNLAGAPAEEPKTTEVEATEADTVAETATPTGETESAPKSDDMPDSTAEVAVEDIMTDGEEEAEEEEHRRLDSIESVMAQALALMEKDPADVGADEIRRLRQVFNMLHKPAEPAEGEEPAVDEIEKQFTAVFEELRNRKTAWTAEQDAKRAANLDRKNAIIEEILALAADTDNVNRTFPRYRELQEEFNGIGDVAPEEETGVWKRFQDAREKYSDNLKINKELRDYDFKKNLAEKEELLAEAKDLAGEEDVIVAYRRLQELHNKWRQIGPVAKELREEIWNNFREASAEVNKRYQAFFEARKAREAENEAAKTALCEQTEALDYSGLKTFAAWEDMTRKLQSIQTEWRKLGFASKKMNRVLFARFRQSCDKFFAAKAEFYRSTREELAANLAHKQELADKAEALKESTDWREATDQFVAMQKEWKAIGAIPKKYSDALWQRFTAACDYFFDRKKKAGSGARMTENANLRSKREIIGELSAILSEGINKEEAIKRLAELKQRWQEIGHVPYKEKDKLFETYRAAIDAVREHFSIAESRARRERFEASVSSLEGDGDKLYRERERLLRALEGRRGELRTYENNLGFLSSKSKKGDSLVRDMERRIERLKADIAEIEEKIKLIDTKL